MRGRIGVGGVCLAVAILTLVPAAISAKQSAPGDVPATVLHAVRTAKPVLVDGRLDDQTWETVPAATGFRQRTPHEGEPASEQTEVRIAYDDTALYVGVRLFDADPSRISRRLTRRDNAAESDNVTLYLDPRHDHLTGALFEVSAAGVQRDAGIYDDRRTDFTWDAVWSSAVTIDDRGWAAEFKIPFSQLRFTSRDHQVWGVNVSRYIPRKQERDWLEFVPRKDARLASKMGHLDGLDAIPRSMHVELMPYTAAVTDVTPWGSASDPFNDGSRTTSQVGLDAKWRLGNGLTLDGTVNPDFGQVEVDPAVINLTAFETSYEEKRPFFLEGTQIFRNFGGGGGNSSLALFYSRRVGRAPQGPARAQYVDRPRATTILGAAKLTGKIAGSWTIGVLDAVTGGERARLATNTVQSSVAIEPLTNYFAGRVSRERSRGGIGLLMTSVTRQSDNKLRDLLPSNAFVTGTDAYGFLDDQRNWVVSGSVAGSVLNGTEAAIGWQQQSSRRYFDRPDANYLTLNPAAKSLAGWTGQVGLRRANGRVTFGVDASMVSPGFEANDLGFHTRADLSTLNSSITFYKYEPDRWSLDRWLSFAKTLRWNFGGDLLADGMSISSGVLFHNYWSIDGGFAFNRQAVDDRLTWGGPAGLSPANWTTNLGFSTNGSRRASLSVSGYHTSDAAGGWLSGGGAYLSWTPRPRLGVLVGPYVSTSHAVAQYVQTVDDPTAVATYGNRYVFSGIDQTNVSLTTRVNVSMTPRMTLQVYAQPFVGVGAYRTLKELTTPRSFTFARYGADVGAISYDASEGAHVIDPDGAGPANEFSVWNPDFNSKYLAVKAVYRWEWRPGSSLYAAWTQLRYDGSRPGEFGLGRDLGTLFGAPAENVFLLKMSYWFSR